MGKFEEMKEKYPRAMIVVQGLLILVFTTIVSYILIAPLYIFDISPQILVEVFTFPADIIPQPYNLFGLLLIPIGMLSGHLGELHSATYWQDWFEKSGTHAETLESCLGWSL